MHTWWTGDWNRTDPATPPRVHRRRTQREERARHQSAVDSSDDETDAPASIRLRRSPTSRTLWAEYIGRSQAPVDPHKEHGSVDTAKANWWTSQHDTGPIQPSIPKQTKTARARCWSCDRSGSCRDFRTSWSGATQSNRSWERDPTVVGKEER